MKIPFLIIVCIFCVISFVFAEDLNLTNTTNLTNITNSTNSSGINQEDLMNTSVESPLTQESEGNQTGSAEKTMTYKESIGSVYSSDYTEPQPRTFSYSGCGQY